MTAPRRLSRASLPSVVSGRGYLATSCSYRPLDNLRWRSRLLMFAHRLVTPRTCPSTTLNIEPWMLRVTLGGCRDLLWLLLISNQNCNDNASLSKHRYITITFWIKQCHHETKPLFNLFWIGYSTPVDNQFHNASWWLPLAQRAGA